MSDGVEKIYAYQAKIETLTDRLVEQVKTYGDLIDTIADLERTVRAACMAYMTTNPDSKKVALEKIELLSSVGDEAKEHYLYLVYLRHKQKSLEKIIEATEAGISACQSLMKYDLATDYTRGNKCQPGK
jgi:hypothetical protein